MGQLTQEHRLISVTDFGLGKDTFVITGLDGSEHISELFEFQLDLLSPALAISPDKVIGKAATVVLHTQQERVFHGLVKSFGIGEMGPHNHRQYRLTLVPWLWFLSKTQNCRVFQKKNVKEIVSQIFADHNFTDFEFKATGGQKRAYCVQYNESDLHFVSRLLEEEGIAYFFQHSRDKHNLILTDKSETFEEVPETNLEFSKGSAPHAQITEWQRLHEFRKGQWTLNDYAYEEPNKNLLALEKTTSRFQNNQRFEHYEYPGHYSSAGRERATTRLQAEETLRNRVRGTSACSSFCAAGQFRLAKHDTAAEQGKYALVSVHHTATDSSFYSGEAGQSGYSNQFVCIPADVTYRPEPRHLKPQMPGPQSAVVVGPAGEEIYLDELGRIKLQFHWDREGQKNEHSSCFVRVMQSWAGNGWGSHFIPRIGHEVIVSFLDGDPDRPLVTGSVYNGKNRPADFSKSQSGIKSRSTKGGNAQNFNQLRFDDKKGDEEIYLHAEKNLALHVENDETRTIENDRFKTVQGNQSEEVGKNKSIRVQGEHSEAISKNMTIVIDKDLSETVGGSYTETVVKDSMHTAKTITFKAEKEIVLQTGSAKIVLKNNGDITISGKNISVKGSGNVVLKGSKVTAN